MKWVCLAVVLLALICCSVFALADVEINSTNFPSSYFRQFIIDAGYDTDGSGTLSEAEIGKVTYMRCRDKSISDLTGIEYFTSLEILNCAVNQLTSLDVSHNTALISLDCYENQLTSLDVSHNTALVGLSVTDNQLTNLDISQNKVLEDLYCYDNPLTSLDVSQNTALKKLICSDTQLTSLDVSNCTALTGLDCRHNKLISLNVSGCTELSWLLCEENQLTSLDLAHNTKLLSEMAKYEPQTIDDVTYYGINNYDGWHPLALSFDAAADLKTEIVIADVEISETNFPDANFRQYIIDAGFDADGNGTLSGTEIGNVTFMDCSSKSISDLTGIEHFTSLTRLLCRFNQLTSLDVSKNTALTALWCGSNQLTSLDVSQNTALTDLNCNGNLLTGLDLSKNTALTYLHCAQNQLTGLDVSQNTELAVLSCYYNQLTSLDLSNNSILVSEIAKYGFRDNGGIIQIGQRNEDGTGWIELVLEIDESVTVLPEGTLPEPAPEPTFILPASTTTIESGAFAGLTDQVFQLPASVTFIADDAFDPSARILTPKDSYAVDRCKKLGLKVFIID